MRVLLKPAPGLTDPAGIQQINGTRHGCGMRGPGPVPEQAERPRSERLARMVKHTNELATTARQPHERLGVYADWTADLKGEGDGVRLLVLTKKK